MFTSFIVMICFSNIDKVLGIYTNSNLFKVIFFSAEILKDRVILLCFPVKTTSWISELNSKFIYGRGGRDD